MKLDNTEPKYTEQEMGDYIYKGLLWGLFIGVILTLAFQRIFL